MTKTITKITNSGTIMTIIGISTLILFISSSLRHLLFQSNAFDLGIVDQAVYLISQGKEPISSLLGFHILGNHVELINYLLALPYIIYPSVYWLFLIQALSLSLGGLFAWYLALNAGLTKKQSIAIAVAYLLYPLIFNVNLFDFHREVIAVPAFLAAVLAARVKNIWWFSFCVILILSCKAVLSLTVFAMGIWLLFFEKRKLAGGIAITSGVAWFLMTTQLIIPFFSGSEAGAVGRYSYLGDSVLEIARNLIFQPDLVGEKVFSQENFGYLVLLFSPVIWGLSVASIQPLIPAIPCIALNLLADYQLQKDLLHQYSLPALPFLILAVIASLRVGKGWLQNRRGIIIWSLIAFLALAKFYYFGGKYLTYLDTWQATREAISQVKTKNGVYTTSDITPHLAHRPLIKLTNHNSPEEDLGIFKYVILNLRHPGWGSNEEFTNSLFTELKNRQDFELTFDKDQVSVFVKK